MSTKIFPFRKYNPNKGKADVPDAPAHKPAMSEEDRIIMRELIKEAEEHALEERATKLRLREAKRSLSLVIPPPPIWFYTPEYAFAFKSLTRDTRKVLARKTEYKFMKEVIEWLEAFQKGAESYCAACGFDITAYEKDLVPYEIIVVERRPLIIEGLCGHCLPFSKKNKEAKIIINLNLNLEG